MFCNLKSSTPCIHSILRESNPTTCSLLRKLPLPSTRSWFRSILRQATASRYYEGPPYHVVSRDCSGLQIYQAHRVASRGIPISHLSIPQLAYSVGCGPAHFVYVKVLARVSLLSYPHTRSPKPASAVAMLGASQHFA